MSLKWDSICEFRRAMSWNFGGCQELEMSYNGNEYFIATDIEDRNNTEGGRIIYTIQKLSNNDFFTYDSLDEMLDNYKEDGKPLRDFILDMEIESIGGVGTDDRPYVNKHERLPSLEDLYVRLVEDGFDLHLASNGKDYFISHYYKKDREVFTFATNRNNENRLYFDSFAEMLDGYREEGKPLRDFILEMTIENDYSSEGPYRSAPRPMTPEEKEKYADILIAAGVKPE